MLLQSVGLMKGTSVQNWSSTPLGKVLLFIPLFTHLIKNVSTNSNRTQLSLYHCWRVWSVNTVRDRRMTSTLLLWWLRLLRLLGLGKAACSIVTTVGVLPNRFHSSSERFDSQEINLCCCHQGSQQSSVWQPEVGTSTSYHTLSKNKVSLWSFFSTHGWHVGTVENNRKHGQKKLGTLM